MSHVYKAYDPVMDRIVAVKILSPAAAADADAKARFLREARVSGSLSHENVISVFDFGEDAGQPYMVMEFLVGEDLRSVIKKGTGAGIGGGLRMGIQLAKALSYIHQHGIIHRDIKPDNVFLNVTGTVKLTDFGIAKKADLNLTRPGMAIGTPYYMPPEQLLAQETTHLADIYSFGILLYELLSGTRPISAESMEQIYFRIINDPVNLDPLRQCGAPAAVCTLVGRCTAKRPEDRPQSMAEVRHELELALRELEKDGDVLAVTAAAAAVETAPAPTRPVETAAGATRRAAAPPLAPASPARTRPAEMRKRFPLLAGFLAGGLAVIGLLGYMASRREPTPPPGKKQVELSPVISTATGEMVLVPAGAFLSGPEKKQAGLDAYYIDRTEVTNAAYAAFCREKGRPFPPGFPQDKPDYPVVSITIVDAREFAAWAGKRLPAALEWEKAARGADGRPYPWGEQRDPSRANAAGHPTRRKAEPMPADALPEGASPSGALNMAGNVWEFVDEFITPSAGAVRAFSSLLDPPPGPAEPWYEMRGGSFMVPLVEGATYEWGAVPARFRAPDIGFRCVKDATPR